MEKKIVVVTPIYEDTQSAEKLIAELQEIFQDSLYLVAVDDGSIREPVEISILNKCGAKGVVLRLIKNVGHQGAIAVGLQYVADKIDWATEIVVMDSDGEDNPNTIKDLLEKLNQKDVDVAVGKRKNRSEAMQFQIFYKVYKFIFRTLTGRSFGFGNFIALKPKSLQRIVIMPELWTHFAASVLSSKLRIAECPLDRGQRYFGQSKLNFVGFALHGFKALMIFSEEVLVRVGIFCAYIAFLSVIGGIIAIQLKFFGIATPGWFSIVMGVFILVFLQTGTLTLMTLLLTGLVKTNVQENTVYGKFISIIFNAEKSR
ncbi:glycosyltransferase [Gammaproteobacteria bacterium]|nr:glycosyltransferase [Gammaproteobacteria bacterium]